jgi:nucleotide-binding universal stress UspA family protein
MNQSSFDVAKSKILVPLSALVDKHRLFRALQTLAIPTDSVVVLFRVLEIPQRTNPLDPELWRDEIKRAEGFLEEPASWLREEGYKVETKVVTARNSAQGIVDEANNGEYRVVLMTKRRIRRGWSKIFHRSISEEVIRYANPLVLTFLAEQMEGE